MNEKTRVKRRFDGKLSDHISSVVSEELESDKDVQIEPTINNLNTIGNSTKPFYFINNLCKKGVSSQSQTLRKNCWIFLL